MGSGSSLWALDVSFELWALALNLSFGLGISALALDLASGSQLWAWNLSSGSGSDVWAGAAQDDVRQDG